MGNFIRVPLIYYVSQNSVLASLAWKADRHFSWAGMSFCWTCPGSWSYFCFFYKAGGFGKTLQKCQLLQRWAEIKALDFGSFCGSAVLSGPGFSLLLGPEQNVSGLWRQTTKLSTWSHLYAAAPNVLFWGSPPNKTIPKRKFSVVVSQLWSSFSRLRSTI